MDYKGYKKYYIHFNSGRPYLVYVKNKDVFVHKEIAHTESPLINNNHDKQKYKNIARFEANKVFIGKSPNIPASVSVGKETDGNTILLSLKKNNYVLIDGAGIKKFKTPDDENTHFFSPIARHDITVPVAIGKKYFYFFEDNWSDDNRYLEKEYFKSYKKEDDLQDIIDKGYELKPFMYNLATNSKSKIMTILEFKEMQTKPLSNIHCATLKALAKLYLIENISTLKTKKELADKIELEAGTRIYAHDAASTFGSMFF
jgi:hypothetical protein